MINIGQFGQCLCAWRMELSLQLAEWRRLASRCRQHFSLHGLPCLLFLVAHHAYLVTVTSESMPSLILITITILCIWIATLRLRKRCPKLPGPRGYPLIGNVFDMPRSNSSEVFAKMFAVRAFLFHR